MTNERTAREEWLANAKVVASRLADLLADEYRVERVYLFGSVASGQAHLRSDIDIAVDGIAAEDYYRAWARLERETDIPVDLVALSDANVSLVEKVRREGVVLFERKKP